MNIGRPKGYIPPPEGAAAPAGGGLAQSLLQSLQPQATTVLLLTNPLPAGQLRTSSDCRIVSALCVWRGWGGGVGWGGGGEGRGVAAVPAGPGGRARQLSAAPCWPALPHVSATVRWPPADPQAHWLPTV